MDVFSVLILGVALAATPVNKKMRAPAYISPTMRAILDERMERHGEAAMRLSMSVVLLDYEDSWSVARGLVNEAGIARPRIGESDTLNAALPALFFTLQDQLRAHAKELEKAAMNQNDRAMAEAYGKLTATCVACHSAYLAGKK